MRSPARQPVRCAGDGRFRAMKNTGATGTAEDDTTAASIPDQAPQASARATAPNA
jgi:hypothetical protein